MNLSRRGFLGGLAAVATAAVAAPAIVRVESLMVLPPVPKIILPASAIGGRSLLTISMIMRDAVRLFKNSNAFIQNLDAQYEHEFAAENARIGTQLRIRYPDNFVIKDAQKMFSYNSSTEVEFGALQSKTPWIGPLS